MPQELEPPEFQPLLDLCRARGWKADPFGTMFGIPCTKMQHGLHPNNSTVFVPNDEVGVAILYKLLEPADD